MNALLLCGLLIPNAEPAASPEFRSYTAHIYAAQQAIEQNETIPTRREQVR